MTLFLCRGHFYRKLLCIRYRNREVVMVKGAMPEIREVASTIDGC